MNEPSTDTGQGFRSALVYATGSALPRAVSFLLLPAYTRAIDPAQYGTLALLFAIAAACGIVFTLGFDFATFRIYFQLQDQPARQQAFIQSSWRFLVGFSLATTLIGGGVFWAAGGHLQQADGLDVLLALTGSAVGTAATSLPLAVLRAAQRLRAYALVAGVATCANAGITLFVVVGLHGGVRGWLVATLAANALTFATTAFVVPWRRGVAFEREPVRRALGLGVPLVPHFFAHWALLLADRLLLAALVSAPALGIYSLASNLALPAMILVQSLNLGFMPAYARAGIGAISRSQLADTVVTQATAVGLICVTGMLLGPPFVTLIAPAKYAGAAPLVAWIVLGYGFLGLYYIPMNGTSLGAGETRFVAVATLISAAVNLGLIWAFVPDHGLTAAAVASAAAYAVLLVAVFLYARRPTNPVEYRWRSLLAVLGLLVLVYTAARLSTPDEGLVSIVARSGWLLAGAALIFWLDPRTRSRALALVRSG